MLRFGIIATLIWHYSVDALYTAFLLLRSPNRYLMISGAVTAGIMLIPLIVAGIAYWRTGRFEEESGLTNASEGVSRAPRKTPEAVVEGPVSYAPLTSKRLIAAGILTLAFLSFALIRVYHFGEGIKLRTTRRETIRLADEFLKTRGVRAGEYRHLASLQENINPLALRYLLERRSVKQTDKSYRQATRLLLWEVRYFRPLEKEEHLVFVDADGGEVFGYRHLLDEDAPGAFLSQPQARALAERAVEEHGYDLRQFDLQESQEQKRKAREDYVFTWQAKPGDPRNVDQARYRLAVDIAGSQVIGFSRYFKLPEDWERQRAATRLPNAILMGLGYLLVSGLVAGGIILFVKQLRSGRIPWRASVKVGAVLAVVFALSELNQIPSFYLTYDTSIPLSSFNLRLAASLLITPLVVGLGGWIMAGLAISIYPHIWQIFRAPARRVWSRDAIIAIVVSLATGAGLSRLGALVADHFHAYAPISVSLVPDMMNTLSPGAGIFLRSLLLTVFYTALAALAIYAVRLGMARRPWWLWTGALLVLVHLGPAQAHSIPEFAVGWAIKFVALVVAIAIVVLFFRDNVLAYVGAAFCSQVAEPLVQLFSQPPPAYRWNGLALAVSTGIVLVWMLFTRRRTQSVGPEL
jgi:hypothetical protein